MTQEVVKIMKPKKFDNLSSQEKIEYIDQVSNSLESLRPAESPVLVNASNHLISRVSNKVVKSINLSIATVIGALPICGLTIPLSQHVRDGINPMAGGLIATIIFGSIAALISFLVTSNNNSFIIRKAISTAFRRKKVEQKQVELSALHELNMKDYIQTCEIYKVGTEQLSKLANSVINDFNINNELEYLTFDGRNFHIKEKVSKKNLSIINRLDKVKSLEGSEKTSITIEGGVK